MFAKALEEVSEYTLPVIISKRLYSGKVHAGCATFIVVNRDGWILTAAHVVAEMPKAEQHKSEVEAFRKAQEEVNLNHQLTDKKRRRQLSKLKANPDWITNHSYWWGRDRVSARKWAVNVLADLALSRLEPFDPDTIKSYPRFRTLDDPIRTGTSLCRLGFPFHEITSTFDEQKGGFHLAPGTLPMPRFPLDGIYTRMAIIEDEATHRTVEFLEMSTPGLRGQSGGPVFDTSGRVCGLQSRTAHLPLGFSPVVKVGSKEVMENQFLNVGLATHVSVITSFLQEQNVSYASD